MAEAAEGGEAAVFVIESKGSHDRTRSMQRLASLNTETIFFGITQELRLTRRS